VEVRDIQATEVEAVQRLLLENEFAGRHVADLNRFRTLLEKSQCALVAVEDGEVIGFARAICDELSDGYLAMLVVAAPCRKKGVGSALVRAVMGSDSGVAWMVRAPPRSRKILRKAGLRDIADGPVASASAIN